MLELSFEHLQAGSCSESGRERVPLPGSKESECSLSKVSSWEEGVDFKLQRRRVFDTNKIQERGWGIITTYKFVDCKV